ncbi:AAA family ATPase [Polyangium jinanense]|uniref:AAA family ATPase n=1 Tax=Polyangium jinanense TaxID=2829994 RepID=A0A9X3X167_9BACT|nr:AAA family ATPase [Polyangium jinanense]MDC3980640.1 AAA family ATPase [Polyangium jinanense]
MAVPMRFWLEGHTLTEVVLEGEVTTLYRGYRDVDGAPVLVEALNEDYPVARDVARIRHEFLVMRGLALPCVPEALGLSPCRNGVALVLSDAGKRPLAPRMRTGRQDVGAVLRLGVSIARALDRVHLVGLVHKDICPANILVDDGTLEVELVGFGHASRLPREDARIAAASAIEGTLAYMAPEQTGRMNRVVDHRADLYALGVTLYELATGALPFVMEDPLELAHAHIARAPVPPHVLAPELPRVVSDIIVKLLAKSADDRYQRARGLEADLAACASAWEEHGQIEPFRLGKHDLGAELVLPQRLYGRERERQQMAQAFERAASGRLGVIVLSGPAGVGKSTLVRELESAAALRGGIFAEGRADAVGSRAPCGLLSSALRDLVRRILGGPPEDARAFLRELARTVDAGSAALFAIVPELDGALGEREAHPPMSAAASSGKLAVLVRALLDAASRQGPLVLFLDDIGAADADSISVVRVLCADPSAKRLCVVLSRQESAPSDEARLLDLHELRQTGVCVTEIALGPLAPSDVRALLGDALGAPEDRVADLADVLAAATHGSPFLLREALRALHAEGFVRFDAGAGAFRWDVELVRNHLGAEGARDLVSERIAALPARSQRILELAACLGPSFDLDTLACVAEREPAAVAQDLWPALEAGLVLPLSSDYRFAHASATPPSPGEAWEVPYAFSHERVHEAVYARIPDSRRQDEHLRLGEILASRGEHGERDMLAAVYQQNRGLASMRDAGQRRALAERDLLAGRRLQAIGALSEAIACFEAGLLALAGDEPHALWFDLTRELCACLVTREPSGAAEALVAALARGARSKLERIEAERLEVARQTAAGHPIEALHVGARDLGELAFVVPDSEAERRAALGREAQAIEAELAGRAPASLLSLPVARSPEAVATMALLLELLAPAGAVSRSATGLVAAALVRASMAHGNTEASAVGYAAYGAALFVLPGLSEAGQAFGDLALALAEDLGEGPLACRVHLTAGSILHARRPRRLALFHFHRAVGQAAAVGDVPTACRAAAEVLAARFELGDDLARACDEAERSLSLARRAPGAEAAADPAARVTLQAVRSLLGRTSAPASLDGDDFDEASFFGTDEGAVGARARFYGHARRAELFLLHEDAASAAREALAAAEGLTDVEGEFLATDLPVWLGLALLLDTTALPSARASRLAQVDAILAELSTLAARCPENYERKWLLVSAERARAAGDEALALSLYEKAIRAAAESGVSRDEALANELAARFHLERRRDTVARAYMGEAYQAYLRWGAITKVDMLRERYGFLLPRRSVGPSAAPLPGLSGEFDLGAVMRATRAIAEEIVLDVLLDRVMRVIVETAGAQRAVLLLDRGSGLHVEAAMTIDPDRVLVGIDAARAAGEELPRALVDEVAATRAPVVLGGSRGFDRFSKDPYLAERRPRSLLCLAMAHRGRLSGVLYLENRAAADVFSEARIAVASFLSSQAAIAVENALLVASIQRMHEAQRLANERLEHEVRARTAELERELLERERAEREKEAIHDAMLTAQEERLRELSAPILPIADGIVVMPLIGVLDERRADEILAAALAGVSSSGARVLILDITGVRGASASVASALVAAASAVGLLGAEVVISGIRAAVARTLVDLGHPMQGIATRATLKGAVAWALARTQR